MTSLVLSQTTSLAKSLSIDASNAQELVAVLKATAFKGQVSDAQMTALLIVAQQYGLNPWTKEIYAFPSAQGIVPVVGLDGWSRIINSHPQFDGMDFTQDDESCTCTIYRKDRNHPVRVTEWMSECKKAGAGPWQSHPRRMLRHKATIQCARLAFGFVGIYEQDEAERIIEATDAPRATRHTATVIQPEDSEARDVLLAQLQDVADTGIDALTERWKAIGPENRKMIGAAALESLKARAAESERAPVDAEFVEVQP